MILLSISATGLDANCDSRRNARIEQLARGLASDFTEAELEQLAAAAPLLERLAEQPSDGRQARRWTRDNYRWVALTNTTLAVFMSALDGSIVIISLPAIFRGIHLDPLAPANIGYLLWMIMGYRLVQAVLVVTLGRIGDMYGRVRDLQLRLRGLHRRLDAAVVRPLHRRHRRGMWLIGWRVLQAVGGSMLTANSAAILTDAFPPDRRGFALGVNQVAALAGQFIGLVAGGLLAAWDWRAVFWVNVPVGVFGTIWAYRGCATTASAPAAGSTGGATSRSRSASARS